MTVVFAEAHGDDGFSRGCGGHVVGTASTDAEYMAALRHDIWILQHFDLINHSNRQVAASGNAAYLSS